MKKVAILVLVMALLIGTVPAFAAQGQRGASARAMERASDEAVFHRIGDWFATRGKSEEEAQAIVAERKAARAAKRAEKELQKRKKEMERAAKKSQKEMKGKMKGFGKK
jgi:hypothetical protein